VIGSSNRFIICTSRYEILLSVKSCLKLACTHLVLIVFPLHSQICSVSCFWTLSELCLTLLVFRWFQILISLFLFSLRSLKVALFLNLAVQHNPGTSRFRFVNLSFAFLMGDRQLSICPRLLNKTLIIC